MNRSLALHCSQTDDGMSFGDYLQYLNDPHRVPSHRSLLPSWVNVVLLPDERFTPEGNARVSPRCLNWGGCAGKQVHAFTFWGMVQCFGVCDSFKLLSKPYFYKHHELKKIKIPLFLFLAAKHISHVTEVQRNKSWYGP